MVATPCVRPPVYTRGHAVESEVQLCSDVQQPPPRPVLFRAGPPARSGWAGFPSELVSPLWGVLLNP